MSVRDQKLNSGRRTPDAGLAVVYFSLGSNVGDRVGHLRAALRAFPQRGITVLRLSSLYETDPVGFTEQSPFLNMAAAGRTPLEPLALWREVQALEHAAGRQRTIRWGPRTLDIDILFYDQLVMHSPELQIPHPRLTERRFVLVPLAEIALDLIHPEQRVSIKTLLERCKDPARVEKYCQA